MAGAGKPKTGGRKKGSRNKNLLGFRERLEEKGFDVIDEMILRYQKLESEEGPAEIAAATKLICEIAQYSHPKLKAVEHTGKDGGPIQVLTLESLVTGSIESK